MLGFTESTARRDVRYTSAASCRVLHRKFVPAPRFTPLFAPLAKFSDHTEQRHLGAIGHPSPPRHVVASVALNLTTRRERPTFAAPPRLAQPSRALSRPSQLNGALKHVVALPLLRNALVFIALRHNVHIRLIVTRSHILSKKLTWGIAWSCTLMAELYKIFLDTVKNLYIKL